MEPRIEIQRRDVGERLAKMAHWKIALEDRRAIVRFLHELSLGRVNRGRRISESRQCKYLDVLRVPLEFFGKASSRLTLRDVETFEAALGSGTLRSCRGGPFRPATRVDIRRALRVYLRWKLGPEKAGKLTGWLDTRQHRRTPEFLREAEVEQLFKACKTARERFLIAVLFDAGARAGEFHNLRYEDVELPDAQRNYVRLTLREEYSKTQGRTISLFWKYSEEAVREYLLQREREGIRSGEPIFRDTYNAGRLFLRRLGKRALGRSVHYHLFRHSSATYYADKLNRQQLCLRYGWAFSSDMPDVYIARTGVDTAELDQKFANVDFSTLKNSVDRLELANKTKEERIRMLETTLADIQQHFDTLVKVAQMNPSPEEIRQVLRTPRARSQESGATDDPGSEEWSDPSSDRGGVSSDNKGVLKRKV